MLKQFTDWFVGLVQAAFTSLFDLISDAAVAVFAAMLSAFGTLLAAIPLPDWLSQGLGSLWSALPPGMVYLASAAGVPQALALIGAGFAFRLLRKIFTLFQW